MRVLGTITTAESLDQTDDLPTLLEPGLNHRNVNQVREQRIGRNHEVTTRHQDADGEVSKFHEKFLERGAIGSVKHGKTRHRAPFASIERGWNPPHSTSTLAQLRLFDLAVFLQAIRWIGDDCMDRLCLSRGQPLESVVEMEVETMNALVRCYC